MPEWGDPQTAHPPPIVNVIFVATGHCLQKNNRNLSCFLGMRIFSNKFLLHLFFNIIFIIHQERGEKRREARVGDYMKGGDDVGEGMERRFVGEDPHPFLRHHWRTMPGLTAPSDYYTDPPRHPCLQVNSKEPFNAEPPRSALNSSYLTPSDFFYKRNHGPVPIVDDIERYCVSISGLIENPKQLFMNDIRKLPKYNVTATLQCAGNRRTAMSKIKTVKGVGWGVSAIGNGSIRQVSSRTSEILIIPPLDFPVSAVWGGAKLADVLELLGIPKLTAITQFNGKHVEFVSVDRCKEEKGGPYKASIPLIQATNPEADVVLAYEMNGEPLTRDHGYPLRVVVPGVIGARSVKWLEAINIIAEECQGFFMQKDYKMFPPSVNWDNINWSTRRPQMDFPVQCVICSLDDVSTIKPGKVKISGYAASGGGRGIERVDVSIDGGKTWIEASRFQKSGIPYITDDDNSDKWAWVLFEVTADILHSTEVIAKAVDSAANTQPEKVEDIWNLRGILNTSWHRIQVQVAD